MTRLGAADTVGGRYVVVTGAIAAGASTLAGDLARRLGWQTHLEGRVDRDNDFFVRAAADFRRWGLASQAHFLLASVDRHAVLADRLAAAGPDVVVVEDRTPFEHTGAYLVAHETTGTLPPDEVALLRRLTAAVEDRFVVPDLLVYRQMDPGQLEARVGGRGRPGESALDAAHLRAVHEAFDRFVARWDRSPVLLVPPGTDVLDPAQGEALARRVATALAGPG